MVIYFFVEHNWDEAGSKRKADYHVLLALINMTIMMDAWMILIVMKSSSTFSLC